MQSEIRPRSLFRTQLSVHWPSSDLLPGRRAQNDKAIVEQREESYEVPEASRPACQVAASAKGVSVKAGAGWDLKKSPKV